MIRQRHNPLTAEKLRQRAEERLRVQALLGKAPQSAVDDQRLLHELQVHMIELEMQNEAYRDALARADADQHLSRRYEFAPVACLSVAHDSTIESLNLAASRLLGLSRAQLKGQRLTSYLDAASGALLPAFLSRVFTGQGVARTTATLLAAATSDAAGAIELQIDALADDDGLLCHLAATDISALTRSANERREGRDEPRRAPQLAPLGSERASMEAGVVRLARDEIVVVLGKLGADQQHATDEADRIAATIRRALSALATPDVKPGEAPAAAGERNDGR